MDGGEGAWRQGRTRHTPEREVTSRPPSSSTLGYYLALQPGMCWCGHGRDSVGPIHHPPALPQHTPSPPGENPGSPCPTRHPNPPCTQLWSVCYVAPRLSHVTRRAPIRCVFLARWVFISVRFVRLIAHGRVFIADSSLDRFVSVRVPPDFGMGSPPGSCRPHRTNPTRPCTLFQAWTQGRPPLSVRGTVRICAHRFFIGPRIANF